MTQTMELEAQSNALITQAQQVRELVTNDHYTNAVELAQVITGLSKSVEEYWAPLKKSAHVAWKNLVAAESAMLVPLKAARASLDVAIRGYLDTQERIRREQEEKLQAEQQRIAQDQALARAEALAAAGNHAAADKVIVDALEAPAAPAIVPRSIPDVKGISQRSTWKFRITNFKQVPEDYKLIDEQAIGAVVRAMKGRTNIPGIEVYEEKGIAIRA